MIQPLTHRRPTRVHWLLLALALTAHSRAATVRFTQSEDLAGCGLRIKLMPNSTPLPLPPASTFTYSSENSTHKEERYLPGELWIRDQHIGRWRDAEGNALTIGRATTLLSGNFAEKHITRDAYSAALQTPDPWTPETLRTWLQQFLGVPVEALEPVKQHSFRLRHLLRVNATTSQPSLVYAFQLNPRSAGQTQATTAWFAVVLTPAAGADMTATDQAFSSIFLPAVTVVPGGSRSQPATGSSFQNPSTLRKGPQSPEMQRSREAAAKSIANMSDWWIADTAHYVLLSNMSSRHRTMIKELQTHIETMRTAYVTVIPPQKPIDAVSVIRLFATPAEYVGYVGRDHEWSGGMWMPMQKELVIRPIDWGKYKQQRDQVMSVCRHEAFHQYLHYAMDQRETSAWFNEGHAEFFEAATVRGGEVIIGESAHAEQGIESLVKAHAPGLPRFLQLSYEQFYAGGDEKLRKAHYALAWAFIYYLRKGAPLEKPDLYSEILPRYVAAIQSGQEADRATGTAFEGVDMAALGNAWVDFWGSRNRRSAARRNRIVK